MKDVVPCSSVDTLTVTVVTRVKPKSARIARGGVESAMRMFGWEHDDYMIRSFVGV
jgi:hypothetical protein